MLPKIITLVTRNHNKQNPEKTSSIKGFRDFDLKFTLYLFGGLGGQPPKQARAFPPRALPFLLFKSAYPQSISLQCSARSGCLMVATQVIEAALRARLFMRSRAWCMMIQREWGWKSRARAYTGPPAGGRICRPGAQPLPLIFGPRNTLAPEGPGHPGPSAFAASGMVWGDAVRLPPFQRGQRGLGSWPQPAGQSPISPVAAATPLPAREPVHFAEMV